MRNSVACGLGARRNSVKAVDRVLARAVGAVGRAYAPGVESLEARMLLMGGAGETFLVNNLELGTEHDQNGKTAYKTPTKRGWLVWAWSCTTSSGTCAAP